jgi:predicted Fe-Mo cluster-binding NifX family protein
MVDMKVAVSTNGKGMDAMVNPRFGRCSHFVLVNPDTNEQESLENPAQFSGGGAGIQAAQLLADKGVGVVLTGHVGPNAFQALTGAGIRIFLGTTGTVSSAIESYNKGELKEAGEPSVGEKAGMGSGTGGGRDGGGGMGRGGGRGGGRGMGSGRGGGTGNCMATR